MPTREFNVSDLVEDDRVSLYVSGELKEVIFKGVMSHGDNWWIIFQGDSWYERRMVLLSEIGTMRLTLPVTKTVIPVEDLYQNLHERLDIVK